MHRQGDSSNHPVTFTPYLRVPPHPEYPSTHSTASGSWAQVVARYLKIVRSQEVPSGSYTVATEGYLLPPRSYDTLETAAVEVGLSRSAIIVPLKDFLSCTCAIESAVISHVSQLRCLIWEPAHLCTIVSACRIYGGLHFRKSIEDGLVVGYDVSFQSSLLASSLSFSFKSTHTSQAFSRLFDFIALRKHRNLDSHAITNRPEVLRLRC